MQMENKANNLICACTSRITVSTVKLHLCLHKAFEKWIQNREVSSTNYWQLAEK